MPQYNALHLNIAPCAIYTMFMCHAHTNWGNNKKPPHIIKKSTTYNSYPLNFTSWEPYGDIVSHFHISCQLWKQCKCGVVCMPDIFLHWWCANFTEDNAPICLSLAHDMASASPPISIMYTDSPFIYTNTHSARRESAFVHLRDLKRYNIYAPSVQFKRCDIF